MLKKCLMGPLDQAFTASLALLAARAFVGLTMALAHGLPKLPPHQMLIDGVGSMGFPAPAFFAWAAALAEFLGGILIAIGLFTRPAAWSWIATMAVAAFIAHGADPFAKKEMALLYLAFSVLIAGIGAGRFSIDAIIAKRLK